MMYVRTYVCEIRYIFHYVVEDGLTYLCMSDGDFSRLIAFRFLNEIKKRFVGMCFVPLSLSLSLCVCVCVCVYVNPNANDTVVCLVIHSCDSLIY